MMNRRTLLHMHTRMCMCGALCDLLGLAGPQEKPSSAASPPTPPWGPSAHFYLGGGGGLRTTVRRRPPRGKNFAHCILHLQVHNAFAIATSIPRP